MAQSLTIFFHSIQPALLWFKPHFFFKRETKGIDGQKYPNTVSLTASTATSQVEPEPEPVILDIEPGLVHIQQPAAYVRDNISPTSSPATQKGPFPICTRGSSSSHSSPSPVSINSAQNSVPTQQGLNPIAQIFKEQELGKAIIGFVMPLTGVFLTPYAPSSFLVRILVLLLLSIGFAVLWNGILLRNVFPRRANVVEQIGAALIIMAVYGLISSVLPNYLLWIPWASFLMVLFPSFWSYYYLGH